MVEKARWLDGLLASGRLTNRTARQGLKRLTGSAGCFFSHVAPPDSLKLFTENAQSAYRCALPPSSHLIWVSVYRCAPPLSPTCTHSSP